MNFFKKFFNLPIEKARDKEAKNQEVNLSLDDSFVHHFLKKGGKFLYCTKADEIAVLLQKIIEENEWKELVCINEQLFPFINKIDIALHSDINYSAPFFTKCEHLIADTGDIMFSSNQLRSEKIASLSEHFIVYATTSQLVKDLGEGLTGIRINCRDNIPNNIGSVKNYSIDKNDNNFLNYGNSNSKNLYLLLYEDL